jgi:hypothetical protein
VTFLSARKSVLVCIYDVCVIGYEICVVCCTSALMG